MMDNIIILFSSSTSAVRMKEALAGKGFRAKVIGTPSRLAPSGCGYSVRTESRAAGEAEQFLEHSGIKSRGVYLDTETEGPDRYRKLPSRTS